MTSCNIIGVEACRPVHADARMTPVVTDDRDMDPRIVVIQNLPQLRGRLMTEHCSFAAGQHGGRLSGKSWHRRMADQIHTAMHAMETAMCQAVRDRAAADAGIDQLPPAHHSVLARSEPGDPAIAPIRYLHSRPHPPLTPTWGQFSMTSMHKSPHPLGGR